MPKKRFCVHGHDTDIVGRYTDSRCRECHRIFNRRVGRENRDQIKRLRYQEQNGQCAYCLKPLSPTLQETCMDHDHKCHPMGSGCAKCYRGLVHSWCNVAISRVEHDPVAIKSAMVYLQEILDSWE